MTQAPAVPGAPALSFKRSISSLSSMFLMSALSSLSPSPLCASIDSLETLATSLASGQVLLFVSARKRV